MNKLVHYILIAIMFNWNMAVFAEDHDYGCRWETVEETDEYIQEQCVGGESFQARISGNLSVSATTQTELVYNAENTDSDSKYNVSTGRYTPGVAGTYFVSASVTFAPGSNVGVGASGYLKIRANGTGTEFGQTSNQGSGDSNDESFHASAVITLDGDDYISVWWYHTATAGTHLSAQSWFSGFRIA